MGISIDISTKHILKIKADALVIPISGGNKNLPQPLKDVDKALDGMISTYLKDKRIDGKPLQIQCIPTYDKIGAKQVILWGTGEKNAYSVQLGYKILGTLGRFIDRERFSSVVFPLLSTVALGSDPVSLARMTAGEIQYALYSFREYKSEKDHVYLKNLTFLIDSGLNTRAEKSHVLREAREGVSVAEAANYSRRLGDTAPNDMTPEQLAKEARTLAKKYKLKYSALDLDKIKSLGMGAFYAVAKGSSEPSYMIFLEYNGGAKGAKPVVLAGKAVTFDTGGVSIKAANKMEEMKYDMCGGAAVLGIMRAAAELRIPCNLVGIIAAAENMPDGRASRPGDIVKSYSGQTIEIISTDAEGRMLLADAISYADKYNPDVIIDFATLTGAVIIALGYHCTGLMGNNESLKHEIEEAGTQSGERVWQFPLWDDYDKQLKSQHADMQNVGGRPAGSITAGAFLKRFVKKGTPWAHLDIAGTAWITDSRSHIIKGATGVGVKMITRYLQNRFQQK